MKMLLSLIVFLVVVGGIAGQISSARAVTISAAIPGSNSNAGATGTAGPGDYIANFYQFALLVGGVLALAVVVYGGILYMTSIGNPSGMDEAKKWLEAALFGILLLAGAYFVLDIINPQLVNLTLPTLQNTGQTVNQPATPAAATTPAATTPGGSQNVQGGSVSGFQTTSGGSAGNSSGLGSSAGSLSTGASSVSGQGTSLSP
jgi:hypothetical protein